MKFGQSFRNVHSSSAVSTSAWTELEDATTLTINRLEIWDSSGETLKLGVGAAGAEQDLCLIPPGGNPGLMDILIPQGMRLAVKAVSATTSVGELVINTFHK
jgi:hypothetical protein